MAIASGQRCGWGDPSGDCIWSGFMINGVCACGAPVMDRFNRGAARASPFLLLNTLTPLSSTLTSADSVKLAVWYVADDWGLQWYRTCG